MNNAKIPMNAQERSFFETLPEGMRTHASGVMLSYKSRIRMLHNYLHELYGERADWARCIAVYEGRSSDTDDVGERIVADPNSIPVLSEEDLDRWLATEADYEALAEEIASTFRDCQASDMRFSDGLALDTSGGHGGPRVQHVLLEMKCAELLGITPRLGKRSFYSNLINRAGMADNEVSAFYNRLYNNSDEGDWAVAGGSFSLLVQELAKRFTDGLMVNFGQTSIVMQAPGRYYYRGENAFYGSSKPGLFRGRKSRMDPLEVFVSLLRMDEAGFLLDEFEAVREWPIGNGTVRYDALMQHYGLPTWLMDVTTDLPTALFFACCTMEGGAWRPLRDDEVRDADSRKRVFNMGGDSRYAVLHRNKVEIEIMRFFLGVNGGYADGYSSGWHRAIPGNDELYDEVVPIGYQPFMRCSAQHGYAIWASDESYDMYKDSRFEKFRIRLSGDLCQRVFAMMDGGAKAFPNGDIPKIDRYLRELGNTTVFTDESFRARCGVFGLDQGVLSSELRKRGYQVKQNPKHITDKRVRQINQRYGIEEALRRVNVSPVMNPMIVF